MTTLLLIDTDIIIDYLRGFQQAATYLEKINPAAISVITVAELYARVKGKQEEHTLENFISLFEILSLSGPIAQLGGIYRRDYGKSHGTGLADALIAATATVHHAKLASLNARHYPMLNEVTIPYEK